MKKKILMFALLVSAVAGGVAYSYSAKAIGPDQGNAKCVWPPGGICAYSIESGCPCSH